MTRRSTPLEFLNRCQREETFLRFQAFGCYTDDSYNTFATVTEPYENQA
jgi:hypothetical protein